MSALAKAPTQQLELDAARVFIELGGALGHKEWSRVADRSWVLEGITEQLRLRAAERPIGDQGEQR